jgi:hypothetical protein
LYLVQPNYGAHARNMHNSSGPHKLNGNKSPKEAQTNKAVEAPGLRTCRAQLARPSILIEQINQTQPPPSPSKAPGGSPVRGLFPLARPFSRSLSEVFSSGWGRAWRWVGVPFLINMALALERRAHFQKGCFPSCWARLRNTSGIQRDFLLGPESLQRGPGATKTQAQKMGLSSQRSD